MSLLDQIAPDLADKIKALSSEQRCRVVARAAEKLSLSVNGLEPSMQSLIKMALDYNTLSPHQVSELRNYADAADEQYLSLQENGAEALLWRNWFAKGRLATGLADVFSSKNPDAAVNAVYELCFVFDDKSIIAGMVESEIQKGAE